VAGDEGRSKDETSDDLFEDLDKFFAPIQDVEWPEATPEEEASSAERAEREPGRVPEPAAEATPPDADQERPASEPTAPPATRRPPGEGHVTVSGPGVSTPPEDPGVLPEGWSAEIPEIPEAGEDDDVADDEPPAPEIEGQEGLFGTETQATEAVSVEDLRQAPPEYEDLPGPEESVADRSSKTSPRWRPWRPPPISSLSRSASRRRRSSSRRRQDPPTSSRTSWPTSRTRRSLRAP